MGAVCACVRVCVRARVCIFSIPPASIHDKFATPYDCMQQKIYNGYAWHSQVAQDLGPGHTVVTCLCDSGQVRM